MKNLIEKKFYADKETVIERLDLFVMMNRITQDEYTELSLLAEGRYKSEEPQPN